MNDNKQLTTDHPWDKLPDESDTAYHRFSIYLELGTDRSISKVRKKTGKSQGYDRHLYRWSSAYNWVERASAYDQYMIKQSLENKGERLKHGQARLIKMMDKALDELDEVLSMGNVLAVGEGGSSVVNQKLRAIENVLDRVGLVKQTEIPDLDNKPVWNNTYIETIYAKMEQRTLEAEGEEEISTV